MQILCHFILGSYTSTDFWYSLGSWNQYPMDLRDDCIDNWHQQILSKPHFFISSINFNISFILSDLTQNCNKQLINIALIFSYFFKVMWYLKGTKRHKSSLPERRKNKDVKISHYLRVASVRCELVYWEKVSHGNRVP